MDTEDKMFVASLLSSLLSSFARRLSLKHWSKASGRQRAASGNVIFSFLFISKYLQVCLIGNIDGENVLFRVN